MESLPLRIQEKIEPEPMSGCWLWTAFLNPEGYGVAWTGTHVRLAHRFVYESLVGEITKRTLDHLCRVRSCVNPSHLRPATDSENIHAQGSQARAHMQSLQTHCSKHGLPLEPDPIKFRIPRRICPQCRSDRTDRQRIASRLWDRAHPEAARARSRRTHLRRKALRLALEAGTWRDA